MTQQHAAVNLQMIRLDQITVLNSRERNARVFEEIIANIKHLGLKKPVTVTPRAGLDDGKKYLLICGEGRMKALKALGEMTIPALVVEVNDEDAFIMSLSENVARRGYRPLELLAGIDQLNKQGYDKKVIAQKTGLSLDYIKGILLLLGQGEERLLAAVGAGRVPLNVAITIAGAGSNEEIQSALQEAYESGKLRGPQLMQARKVLQHRTELGRSVANRPSRKTTAVTTSSLVRSYQNLVERQKLVIKKAEFAQQRLLFVVEALRQMLADEHFSNLLRAEGLDTLPKYLADRVWPAGHTS